MALLETCERLGLRKIPARGLPNLHADSAREASGKAWTPCTAPWPERAASRWIRAMAQLLDGLDVVYAAEEPAESSSADDADGERLEGVCIRVALE